MVFRLAAIVLAGLAVAAIAAEAAGPPGPGYYVMRHLQKAAGEDPGLTEAGGRNAARLPALLAEDPPAAIYVSMTRRARETAAPLAGALGLAPKEYDSGDTPALIARVRTESGTVLIVGHSNTVPEIVERLGGTRPAEIRDDRFGDIWRVARDGATTHMRVDAPPTP